MAQVGGGVAPARRVTCMRLTLGRRRWSKAAISAADAFLVVVGSRSCHLDVVEGCNLVVVMLHAVVRVPLSLVGAVVWVAALLLVNVAVVVVIAWSRQQFGQAG